MGGFTQIILKDCSTENVERQNAILDSMKVPKKYRFNNLEKEQISEYEYFKKGLGIFPEHCFPRKEISSLEDFKKFWNPKALGEIFVPSSGRLNFDCYFGRTSKRAMRKLGKYIFENFEEIEEIDGSSTTFMERGMTKKETEFITKETSIKI